MLTSVQTLDPYEVLFLSATVPTPLGDFDLDGDVDGHDFLKWQRGDSLVPLSATDLSKWQESYGNPAQFIATALVPEPHSLLLGAVAGLFLLCINRRSQSI